jgi:hypothetical protein
MPVTTRYTLAITQLAVRRYHSVVWILNYGAPMVLLISLNKKAITPNNFLVEHEAGDEMVGSNLKILMKWIQPRRRSTHLNKLN